MIKTIVLLLIETSKNISLIMTIIIQLPKKPKASRMRVNYKFEDDEDPSNTLDIDGLQDVWDEFSRLMKALLAHPSSEAYIEPKIFLMKM